MRYTMSMKEQARLAVIKSAIGGAYTVKQAALKLGLSTRQVKRLKKGVREQGGSAVIHGNSDGHPANVSSEAVRAKITALKKSGPYRQANFTHFRELVEENEQMRLFQNFSFGTASSENCGFVGRRPKNHKSQRLKLVPSNRRFAPCALAHSQLVLEQAQITISYTCLSRILKEAGIASPKTRRSGGEGRSPGNWYKRTPRRLTGSARGFNMPSR
jgi:transposase